MYVCVWVYKNLSEIILNCYWATKSKYHEKTQKVRGREGTEKSTLSTTVNYANELIIRVVRTPCNLQNNHLLFHATITSYFPFTTSSLPNLLLALYFAYPLSCFLSLCAVIFFIVAPFFLQAGVTTLKFIRCTHCKQWRNTKGCEKVETHVARAMVCCCFFIALRWSKLSIYLLMLFFGLVQIWILVYRFQRRRNM